jgi:hypothetical protein
MPPTAAKRFFKGVCVLFLKFCFAKLKKQNTHALISLFFGISKLITEYLSEYQEYGAIKKAFSINILYFRLGQGKDYIYEKANANKPLKRLKSLWKKVLRFHLLLKSPN